MRFHRLEEFLRTPVGRYMMGSEQGGADFSILVRDAQKFYGGEVCALDNMKNAEEFPNLPYPLCIFEFQNTINNAKSITLFMLCEEFQAHNKTCDFVRIHCFIRHDVASKDNEVFLHAGSVEVNKKTSQCFPFFNKNTFKFYKNAKITDLQLELSLMAAMQYVARFLSVLNCSNVEIKEIDSPSIINKKRKKNGKIPIYSYKTLVLKTRQQRLDAGIGTHESPRIHLRRGHIKRRKTGNFWWQPCVVGDRKKGVVMKDYKADGIMPKASSNACMSVSA